MHIGQRNTEKTREIFIKETFECFSMEIYNFFTNLVIKYFFLDDISRTITKINCIVIIVVGCHVKIINCIYIDVNKYTCRCA